MRYVAGVDEKGLAIDVRDPLSSRLAAVAEASSGDHAKLAAGLLDLREVFPAELAGDPRFREPSRLRARRPLSKRRQGDRRRIRPAFSRGLLRGDIVAEFSDLGYNGAPPRSAKRAQLSRETRT